MCSKGDSYCLQGHHTVDQWAWVGVDIVLFSAILVGNMFTVYVLLNKSTKSISNQFVLSLAITDILVGLTLPYHMAFTIFPELSVSKTTCILRFTFVLLACCCSILNVTAIAVDRYVAIVHPFKYETLMTRRLVRRVLFINLVTALTMSTAPIYWNNWDSASVCELGQVLPRYYLTAIMLPSFLIIWVIMISIYTRIWREALVQAEKMRRTNVSTHCQGKFQVVLLVMGCFTFCWLPFLGVTCAQAVGYRDQISSNMYKAVLSLALSSSAFNPLIYAWKNTEFKKAVKSLVKCVGWRRNGSYEDKESQRNPEGRAGSNVSPTNNGSPKTPV